MIMLTKLDSGHQPTRTLARLIDIVTKDPGANLQLPTNSIGLHVAVSLAVSCLQQTNGHCRGKAGGYANCLVASKAGLLMFQSFTVHCEHI